MHLVTGGDAGWRGAGSAIDSDGRADGRGPVVNGHRVLRVCGKGTKVALIPLPPAVARAIDQATGTRTGEPVLRAPQGGMTGPALISTATRTTSSPSTWPPAPESTRGSCGREPQEPPGIADERASATPGITAKLSASQGRCAYQVRRSSRSRCERLHTDVRPGAGAAPPADRERI